MTEQELKAKYRLTDDEIIDIIENSDLPKNVRGIPMGAFDALTALVDGQLAKVLPAIEDAKKAMLGKIITHSVVRKKIDIADKKKKNFRMVDEPVEWWDNLIQG